MPLSIGNCSGDGIAVSRLDTQVQLPDTFPDNVSFVGTVQPIGVPATALTGSPLVAPSVPASGTVWWNLQADPTTGAVNLQQSTTGDPSAVLAADGVTSCVVFLRANISAGAGTDPALVNYDSTPDSW